MQRPMMDGGSAGGSGLFPFLEKQHRWLAEWKAAKVESRMACLGPDFPGDALHEWVGTRNLSRECSA